MDYKQHTIKLALNPKFKSTIETDLVAWSHDKNSYKFYFELSDSCGNPMILDKVVGRIKLNFLKEDKTIIESLKIDSENLGLASFTIPEGVLGYEGKVVAHVYIDYESQTHDLGNFSFLMKKSSIDNKLPDLEFYVSEWDEAMKQWKEVQKEVKEIADGLDLRMKKIERKIEENDLVTRPEAGNFNSFRPDDFSIMDKMRNEFEERGFNVKSLVDKKNISLNDAFDLIFESKISNDLFVPAGNYYIDGELKIKNGKMNVVFNKNVKISVRTPKVVKTEYVILDVGSDVELDRINVKGLSIDIPKFSGIKTIGMRINANNKQGNAIVDSNFSDIRISGANVGLVTGFSWGINFDNIRLQNCEQDLEINSQSNNFNFNRCSFVSFQKPNVFWNAEMVSFNSCEFANFVGTGKVVNDIFQSSVSFTDSYVEYINKNEGDKIFFISVGSYNDKISSTIRFVGGNSTDKYIYFLNKSDMPTQFQLFKPRTTEVVIETYVNNQSEKALFKDVSVPSDLAFFNYGDVIKLFDGSKKIDFLDSWGGGGVLKEFDEKKGTMKITYTSETGSNGIRINGLTKGETYTLIYSSEQELPFQNGTLLSSSLKESGNNIYYLVFKANADSLRFSQDSNQSFEFSKLAVLKGVKFPII